MVVLEGLANPLEVLKTFPNTSEYVKTIESFGKAIPEEKEAAEKFGLAMGEKECELLVTKKTDISTIMYTSGTTGDPKGVMISNDGIVTLIAGVKRLLGSVNEQLTDKDVYTSCLPLAHIFVRVIEELFIHHGAAIRFWHGIYLTWLHFHDVKFLIEDIGDLKPTIFCVVPRVLDRIYSGNGNDPSHFMEVMRNAFLKLSGLHRDIYMLLMVVQRFSEGTDFPM